MKEGEVKNLMRLSLLEHILPCKLSEFYMEKLIGKHFCRGLLDTSTL
jgi:hypothetical protein